MKSIKPTFFVTLGRDALLAQTVHGAAVANGKVVVPGMAVALLTAKDGALTLAAGGVGMGWRGTVAAEVRAPGELAVNAVALHDQARALPEGPVRLKATDKTLTLTSVERSRSFRLAIAPDDQRPVLPPPDPEPVLVKVEAAGLAALLRRVRHAASKPEPGKDGHRANMHGVHLAAAEGVLFVEASDGNRGVRTRLPATGEAEALVPLGAVGELLAVLEAAAGEVTIEVHAGKLWVRHGSDELVVSLVEATFPNLRRVIPSESDATWTADLDRAALHEALKALLRGGKATDLWLRRRGGKLLLDGRQGTEFVGEDLLPLDGSPPRATVGLNPALLAEAVDALGDVERVRLAGAGAVAPVCVRPLDGPHADGSIEVVMPQRLEEGAVAEAESEGETQEEVAA